MKIILSPAKSLDFEKELPTSTYSDCAFLKQASELNKVLKQKSPEDLSKLMKISEKLANLNWERNQQWQTPFTTANSRQAIYTFTGTVYEGLDVFSLPRNKIEQLQDKVRILSGQYGILKPLDLMQAYRLEMGTKLVVNDTKNLYQFWENSITDALNKELNDTDILVNLASVEYFKSVKKTEIKAPIITPVFKDSKNGNLKIIAFFAKKARGMMTRYILDNNIENTEDLKGFNYSNYAFDSNLSSETELVFTR